MVKYFLLTAEFTSESGETVREQDAVALKPEFLKMLREYSVSRGVFSMVVKNVEECGFSIIEE
jgi:hypothetical protein